MKRTIAVCLACLTAAALLLSGCGKVDDKLTPPPIVGNERTFDEEAFSDPALKFRPLPIIHASEFETNGVDKATLDMLKEYGYGGVATNVSFLENYLESEEMWDSLVSNVEYAIEELGLRVWLYDELHYPSGAAGGLVLRDHPEWQAEGLVNGTKIVSAGESVEISAPHGHSLAFAKAFAGTGVDDMDLSDCVDLMPRVKNGTLTWQADKDRVVAVQYVKYFYEGTHAVNNWAELRRYINVLKAEPVQEFIRVTHEQYKSRLGKYFGNGIEAFFTDEPSMLGTYFDGPPRTPGVKDPVDPDIPLLPTANYSSDMTEKFLKLRGYSPENYYSYLYEGESDAAKRFRWDYYKTLGELMASNYSGQIGAWCEDNGVSLTGHFLLEEDIYMHPIFNGNIMRNLSNMQMPGIDLLTANPATAVNWCSTTAKFAASAAHFGGKSKVMSEVSAAFDAVETSDMYAKLGSVAVQYAMGVNQIGTFYRPHQMSEEENRLFTDTIGRMGYMLDGGVHESNVAVYYPIEGIYIDTLPPAHLNRFNDKVRNTSANFSDLVRTLVANQIDYDVLDAVNLAACEVEEGALVTPSGERFKAIVVPRTKALEDAAVQKLAEAAAGGVSVIMQNTDGILSNTAAGQAALTQALDDITTSRNFSYQKTATNVSDYLRELGVKSVVLEKSNRDVVAVKHKYKNNSVFMFVNSSPQNVNITVRLNEIGDLYRQWDVYGGAVELISVRTEGEETIVDLSLPANRCTFITVE